MSDDKNQKIIIKKQTFGAVAQIKKPKKDDQNKKNDQNKKDNE